jgi:ABC-type proline/glycine betaine transport system ATPase subunit
VPWQGDPVMLMDEPFGQLTRLLVELLQNEILRINSNFKENDFS